MPVLNFFKRGVWIFKRVKNPIHFLKITAKQCQGLRWLHCAGDESCASISREGSGLRERSHPHTLPMPGKAGWSQEFCSDGRKIQFLWHSAGLRKCLHLHSLICPLHVLIKGQSAHLYRKTICNKKSSRVNWLIVNWRRWSKNWAG